MPSLSPHQISILKWKKDGLKHHSFPEDFSILAKTFAQPTRTPIHFSLTTGLNRIHTAPIMKAAYKRHTAYTEVAKKDGLAALPRFAPLLQRRHPTFRNRPLLCNAPRRKFQMEHWQEKIQLSLLQRKRYAANKTSRFPHRTHWSLKEFIEAVVLVEALPHCEAFPLKHQATPMTEPLISR